MKNIVIKVWNIFKTVLVIGMIVITISLFVMKLMGDTPSIFGYSFYYIATESMEPSLEVGDVILAKEVTNFDSLSIGDVITYQGEVGSYANKLITHQIIGIDINDGIYTFTTKGTHPSSTVDPLVSQDQVVSKMVFEIPLMGKLMKVINNPFGFLLLIALPLAICLFGEIKNFIEACKNKEEDEEDSEVDEAEEASSN